jgi:hypothetical protein
MEPVVRPPGLGRFDQESRAAGALRQTRGDRRVPAVEIRHEATLRRRVVEGLLAPGPPVDRLDRGDDNPGAATTVAPGIPAATRREMTMHSSQLAGAAR